MCILFVYTLLKVVSYYDLNILSNFILDFVNIFLFAKTLRREMVNIVFQCSKYTNTTHKHAHTYMHTRKHAQAHTIHTQTHTHTHTHTHNHTITHTHIHTHARTHARARTHIHTHINTRYVLLFVSLYAHINLQQMSVCIKQLRSLRPVSFAYVILVRIDRRRCSNERITDIDMRRMLSFE